MLLVGVVRKRAELRALAFRFIMRRAATVVRAVRKMQERGDRRTKSETSRETECERGGVRGGAERERGGGKKQQQQQ